MSQRLVAVLDENNHLVGTTRKTKLAQGDVHLPEEFDLPTDGTYKWAKGEDGTWAFWPLGHGFSNTPTRPPVSDFRALYDVIRAVKEGRDPIDALRWATWYEKNVKQREEERDKAMRQKAKRT